MENNFTVPSAYDIARAGSMNFTFGVEGFWSSSVISLYVSVDNMLFAYSALGDLQSSDKLKIVISPSSGGRDTAQIKEDEIAYNNYANTLLQVNEFASKIRAMADEIAIEYKKYRDELKVQFENESIAQQNAIDNDSNVELHEIMEKLKSIQIDSSIEYRLRGSKSFNKITRLTPRCYHTANFATTVGITTMANKLNGQIAEFK